MVIGPYAGVHPVFRDLQIRLCANCGLSYATPQPSAAALETFYSSYWDGSVAVSTPSTRRYYFAQSLARVSFLEDYVRLPGSPFVLDMGAGLGLFQSALVRRGYSPNYTAVEPDQQQSAALASRFGSERVFARLDDIPENARYDLIVLAHVLEHVPNPNELVSTLLARLAPTGTLLIEVPNRDFRYKANYDSHLLFFDSDSLSRLLQRHGSVIGPVTVGRMVSGLKITQLRPDSGWSRAAKELIKGVISALTPDVDEREISRHQMRATGGDRQWLRALVRLA